MSVPQCRRKCSFLGVGVAHVAFALAQPRVGIWSFQQVSFSFGRREAWQTVLITQPRFNAAGWETILLLGQLGYRINTAHLIGVGGHRVYLYQPRVVQQWRLFQRWQGTFSQHLQGLVTIEERWQDGRFWELLIRPMWRYRWDTKSVSFSLTQEGFLSVWGARDRWRFYPRQNRIWLAVAYPARAWWQVEVGYLHVARTGTHPLHRLWLAARFTLRAHHKPAANKPEPSISAFPSGEDASTR